MISINGDELQKISGTTFIDKVVQLFIQQGGVAKSPFGDVVLDRKGAKNSKSHGIGSSKAQAYAAIKDVLEQGAIQLPMAQYNTNPNKKLLTGMIAANIQIGSVPYTCVVEVCKNADGLIRLYNHEVTPIQTQKPQDVVATSRVSDGEITTRQHQGAMAKIAKDFQNTNTQIKNQEDTNMKTENKKRNVVRLTESQLKQMITESVKNVLKEGMNNGLHEDLSGIIQSLEQLANSNYIPFSSPSPSSTESVVKHNVKKAIELLTFADIAAQQLRY